MISIIVIILIFILGFCFGGLFGLKIEEEVNDEWVSLATAMNDDWQKYCQTLIDKIKTLEEGDTDDR